MVILFLNKTLALQWNRPCSSLGKIFLYLFQSNCAENVICLGSSGAYEYHGTERLIDEFCAIENGSKFFNSFKDTLWSLISIWSIKEQISLFLTLTSLSKIMLLYISSSANHSSKSECHTFLAK